MFVNVIKDKNTWIFTSLVTNCGFNLIVGLRNRNNYWVRVEILKRFDLLTEIRDKSVRSLSSCWQVFCPTCFLLLPIPN